MRNTAAASEKNTARFRVEPLPSPVKMPDRVTAALLALIRSGAYPERSRLPSEMEMAARFGVSRTVIREAVSRLKSEGLVESRQGSGVYVRGTSLDAPFRIDPSLVGSARNVLQIAELRRGLESEIAALAAERRSATQLAGIRRSLRAIDRDVRAGGDGVDADMEFHRGIARATGNPHFLALWDFLGQFLKGAMTVTRALEARRRETMLQVLDEHEALVDAIANRDAEGARKAARRHMEMAAHRIATADPALLARGGRRAAGAAAERAPRATETKKAAKSIKSAKPASPSLPRNPRTVRAVKKAGPSRTKAGA